MNPPVCELCCENTAEGRIDQTSIVVATVYPTAAALSARGRRLPKGTALCQLCGEQVRPDGDRDPFAEVAATALHLEVAARLGAEVLVRPADGARVWAELVGPESANGDGRVVHAWGSGVGIPAAVEDLRSRISHGDPSAPCANCRGPGVVTWLGAWTLPEGWSLGAHRVFRAHTRCCAVCVEGARELESWRAAA